MKLASLLLPAATIAAMGHPLVLFLPHSADSASIPDEYNQNHHSLQSSEEGKQSHRQSSALQGNGDFHAILRAFHDQDDIVFSKPPTLSNNHHRGRKIVLESLFKDEGQEGEQDEGLSDNFPIDNAAAVPAKGGNDDTDMLEETYFGTAAVEKTTEFEKMVELNEKVEKMNQAEGGIFAADNQDGGVPQDVVIIDDPLTAQEMKKSKKSNKKKKNKKKSSGKSGKSSSSKSSSKSRKRSKANKKNNNKKKKHRQPTIFPTMFPTTSPTIPSPTVDPIMSPSGSPTSHSTNNPSRSPTDHPTNNPTRSPTEDSTNNPTTAPSITPSMFPTTFPSTIPSHNPTPTSTLSEVTQTDLQMVLSGESIQDTMDEGDMSVFEMQTAQFIMDYYNDGNEGAAVTSSFVGDKTDTNDAFTRGLRKLTKMEELERALTANQDVHIVSSTVTVTQQTLSQNPSSLSVEYTTSLLYQTTANPTNEDVDATNNEGVNKKLVTEPFETPESRQIYLTQYLQSGTSGSEFFTQIVSVSKVSLPDETYQPSLAPTDSPSSTPSDSPSYHPSLTPSIYPSEPPLPQPTISPVIPTSSPTFAPTIDPENEEDIFVNSTFHLALIQQTLYLNGTILNITANDTQEMEDVTRKFLFDNIGGESKFQVENLTIDEIAVERQQQLQRLDDGVVIDDDDEEGSVFETIVFRMNALFRMKASFVEWIENGQEGDDDYDVELDEDGEGYFDTAGVGSGERRKLMMINTLPQWKNAEESMESRLLKSATCGRNDYAECCVNGAINEDADSKTCKEAGCTKKRCKKKPPKNRRELLQHSRDGEFVVDSLHSIDRDISWMKEGRYLQASNSYWGLDFLDVIRQYTTNFEPNATKSILNATNTDSVATCTSNRYSEITNSSAFACDVYANNNCEENEDLDLKDDEKCSSSAPSTAPSVSLAPSVSSMPSVSSAPSVVPSIEPSSSPPTLDPTVTPNTPHPTQDPSESPSTSFAPTSKPTNQPSITPSTTPSISSTPSTLSPTVCISSTEYIAPLFDTECTEEYCFQHRVGVVDGGDIAVAIRNFETILFFSKGSNREFEIESSLDIDYVPFSIAIAGGYVFVGSPFGINPLGSGLIHVYHSVSGVWSEAATYFPPDLDDEETFAMSIDIDSYNANENVIVVGSEVIGRGNLLRIFRCTGTSCAHEATLWPDNSEAEDQVWPAVSISGDMVVFTDNHVYNGTKGALYFAEFNSSSSTWQISHTITNDDCGSAPFGDSLAFTPDGKGFLVGCYQQDNGKGAVYYYTFNTTNNVPILEQKISGINDELFGYFTAMSIGDDILSIGTGSLSSGNVYLFRKENGLWNYLDTVVAPPGVGTFFGAITSLTSDENGDHDLLVSAGNNAYHYTYHKCPLASILLTSSHLHPSPTQKPSSLPTQIV
mmetsp:Transcript_3616/g.7725  ORF Transcript_3616/g.7725 Transcript_3616/m.7725 type:complete len:1409 (+) Transcript_3616:124-4350(+)